MYPHDSNYTDPAYEVFKRPRRSRRKRSRRRRRRNGLLRLVVCVGLILIVGASLRHFLSSPKSPAPADTSTPDVSTTDTSAEQTLSPSVSTPIEPDPVVPPFTIHTTPDTAAVPDDFPSKYVVLLDMETGDVLTERGSNTVINPASMTKIMTLLVAVENITDWDASHPLDRTIADYCYSHKCSVVGYMLDEPIYAREALYGCILCSGADACLVLADLACGSHEAFVEKMNEKAAELGLSETTHFTNCIGLYDENHHCTPRDMALILKAALENDMCRQVLTTKKFQTQPTAQHPNGQALSNWFIRRIEDLDMGDVTVLAAKTGYVSESGFCAASYAKNESGREFLCVTGQSTSTWRSIYDHQQLYKTYGQSQTTGQPEPAEQTESTTQP